MADLLNKLVKFNVLGGTAFGTVTLINDAEFEFESKKVKATKENPFATVELLTGQKTVMATSALTVITSDELKNDVKALINTLCTKADIVTLDSLLSEVDTLKTNITTITDEKTGLTKQVEDALSDKIVAEAALVAANTENKALADKLVGIEKSAKAKSRAEELKALESLDTVAATESEALVKLTDMSDEVYNAIKHVASAGFRKLAEARKAAPEVKSETKVEEVKAEVVAEIVLEVEKETPEVNLATAASTSGNESFQILADHVENLLGKNKNRKIAKKN